MTKIGLDLDPGAVARRQLQVVFALDCSGSMQGDRIASLNYAMRAALPELAGVAADNPEVDVRVRLIRFASAAQWVIEAPTPLDDLKWTDLAAEGETHMGDALAAIGAVLTQQGSPGRQLPPVVVLVSDGLATDDFEAGLAAFFAAQYAGAAVRVAIAIGADADQDVLQRFIGNPAVRPLRAANATSLVDLIKWATTAPVKAASSPTGAPEILTPPRQAEAAGEQPSDIIW